MTLDQIAGALRASRGFAHKGDISGVVGTLARHLPGGVAGRAGAVAVSGAIADTSGAVAAMPGAIADMPGAIADTSGAIADRPGAIALGDDCAALPDGDGYLLFAIEGLVDEFVQRMPWFAGYCGVMVNVSDIYAMGGRPLAVVDALWSHGAQGAEAVLDGMAQASARYGVPIVGGHTNQRSPGSQLAVAILGRATKLLTSFDARPGDALVMAVDLRGAYQEPYPYWNASTEAPAARLRADLELLPALAEDGLCDAAKDISMAGAIGTALMLLECSKVGGEIDLAAVPAPSGTHADDAALLRWLSAFPSYGFVLSVRPDRVDAVLARFAARAISAAVVGEVTHAPTLTLRRGGERSVLWDLAAQPFICERVAAPIAEQNAEPVACASPSFAEAVDA